MGGRDPLLTYRLLMSDPASPVPGASDFGVGTKTTTMTIRKIESLFGDIHVQVRYRLDCPFRVRAP